MESARPEGLGELEPVAWMATSCAKVHRDALAVWRPDVVTLPSTAHGAVVGLAAVSGDDGDGTIGPSNRLEEPYAQELQLRPDGCWPVAPGVLVELPSVEVRRDESAFRHYSVSVPTVRSVPRIPRVRMVSHSLSTHQLETGRASSSRRE